jgi:NitT/TauT family transport system permease protein
VSRTSALDPPVAVEPARGAVLWPAAAAGVGLLSLIALRYVHHHAGSLTPGFWIAVVLLWLAAWKIVGELASLEPASRAGRRLLDLLVPLCFGAFLLFLWEVLTVGLRIPMVLLPSPSAIWARIAASAHILRADFIQTFIRAVLPGWALGCASGFFIAVLADRVPFLARGLIPIGNFVSALPIIGIAPIMVMWFGFDWHSKAAVVVVMTFFPMLVNTIAGLSQASHLERDLMRSYGASYGQTLMKLRLWAALPFIFNALKINSTLALIGAIVAEFFGTPIVGMGFRISTEVGRMSLDMVWAEIAVAALAGSTFYGLLALLERAATFWHPSYRGTPNN